MSTVHMLASWLAALPPDPQPVAPPGSAAISGILDNLKWLAGGALIAGFLGGLIAFVGGRLVDHHRFGRVGVIMMLCAVGGGLLYGIGYQVINHFAGSG